MALTQLKTGAIADDAVTTDKLANAINTERTANTAKVSLDADSVTGAKIADDAVGAEHIEQLDADLSFADDVKAKFGAGNDLNIWHDGSDSYIRDSGTGGLRINSNALYINNAAESENMIRAFEDGAVELYYDNTKKFETTAAGCKISTGVLDFFDSVEARFGSGGDFKIYHDGSHSYLKDSGTGDLRVLSNVFKVNNAADNETMAVFTENGAVELYYDDSKKFETISTGIETAEIIKMKHGSNGVNIKSVHEAGVGNTASTTATVPSCVGGGTVTVTCMHNGNTSITTTKMYPIMIQGTGTVTLGSEIFSINALTEASMSVSAAAQGVTVTNNAGAHAKIRVTFDITANA